MQLALCVCVAMLVAAQVHTVLVARMQLWYCTPICNNVPPGARVPASRAELISMGNTRRPYTPTIMASRSTTTAKKLTQQPAVCLEEFK